jgi:hypothetical protein
MHKHVTIEWDMNKYLDASVKVKGMKKEKDMQHKWMVQEHIKGKGKVVPVLN